MSRGEGRRSGEDDASVVGILSAQSGGVSRFVLRRADVRPRCWVTGSNHCEYSNRSMVV